MKYSPDAISASARRPWAFPWMKGGTNKARETLSLAGFGGFRAISQADKPAVASSGGRHGGYHGFSRGAPFLDFSEVLASPYYPSEKPNFLVWKILFVATLLLFALVSWPKTAALEPTLTSENLLMLINQDRQETGIAPLTLNSQLQQAALLKAQDILEHNYFAHISPSGTTPWDFIKQTGLPYAFAGENLALNYLSAYELENDFLQSPSHRDNLLSPLFSQIGLAVVPGPYQGQNAIIIVQMFAD